MKINKQSDILINVALPLSAAYFIYVADFFSPSLQVARNYIPDGLWAYAFLSAMLIVWKRQINLLWITLIFVLTVGYELSQSAGILPGTGDMIDLIFYAIFFSLALFANRYFKKLSYTLPNPS